MRDIGAYATTSDAYVAVLAELADRPEHRPSPRGLACLEVTDLGFTVLAPSNGPLRTACPARDAVMEKYLAAEEAMYATDELRAVVWAERASRFWGSLGDADGNVSSNYGHLVFRRRSLPGGRTPWEWARDALRRDPGTRQAFVRVSLPDHQRDDIRDQVCTLHLNFLLRGGRLGMTTVMRSNDAVRGLAYDMPWFCGLLSKMAGELAAPVGTYTHLAHSMHLYVRDVPAALAMLGRAARGESAA